MKKKRIILISIAFLAIVSGIIYFTEKQHKIQLEQLRDSQETANALIVDVIDEKTYIIYAYASFNSDILSLHIADETKTDSNFYEMNQSIQIIYRASNLLTKGLGQMTADEVKLSPPADEAFIKEANDFFDEFCEKNEWSRTVERE